MQNSSSSRSDFVVFNRSGEIALAVEAKSRLRASATWAAQMRRNLLAHGVIPKAKYFLLALPDRFYLWRGKEEDISTAPPTYEIDPSNLLSPYLAPAGLTAESLSGPSFDLVVGIWLRDLLQLDELSAPLRDEHPWLGELYDEVRGGRLESEAVA